MDQSSLLDNETPVVLTQQEIDRRIGDVAEKILAAPADEKTIAANGTLSPQWITASELVRRMAPFMVQN